MEMTLAHSARSWIDDSGSGGSKYAHFFGELGRVCPSLGARTQNGSFRSFQCEQIREYAKSFVSGDPAALAFCTGTNTQSAYAILTLDPLKARACLTEAVGS